MKIVAALSSKRGLYKSKTTVELLILCLPVVIILFLFNYLPMGGIILAFKRFMPLEGIIGSPWNGLKNFEFLFRSSHIWVVTRNTILYNLGFLVLTPLVSISIAVVLYESGKTLQIKFFQTIFFLPHFLSWVVVSIMLYAFLGSNGFFNMVLTRFGFDAVSWYTEAELWPVIILFMGIWKQFGYNTIIYYAALVGMDPGLHEAAAIDGATRIQRILRITVPMLMPLVAVLTIIGLGRIFFADFGLFYQLPLRSGSLLPTTDVINYYTFRTLMVSRNYGVGTAIGLYQSIMGFVLVIVSNWAAKMISSGEYRLY